MLQRVQYGARVVQCVGKILHTRPDQPRGPPISTMGTGAPSWRQNGRSMVLTTHPI